MGVVVTYDVGSGREDLTGMMLRRGYARGWTLDGVAYTLPEGSLWHETASVDAAIADLKSVARDCGVELNGTMAVETDPWASLDARRARTASVERDQPRETVSQTHSTGRAKV